MRVTVYFSKRESILLGHQLRRKASWHIFTPASDFLVFIGKIER